MPTTFETVFAALPVRLQPLAALTLRDEVLPEPIPAGLPNPTSHGYRRV